MKTIYSLVYLGLSSTIVTISFYLYKVFGKLDTNIRKCDKDCFCGSCYPID